MGLKDAAKKLMADAGVPTTPGYLGEDQSEARLAREAASTGYPVLIKAVAGGGGKGMRKVESAAEFAAALGAAKREAKAAFGDDRVLIEKYVTRPRHIEVQVFGDTFGGVVHLFERDCSLQRRHQKVIEEAPAPGMDPETRAAVCEAAVKAAKAVGYVGAGTVEFIADASNGLRADRIWFMEMNTRLQVEHPVTEAITGQDLVEWQLRVASGEPLPLRQDQLSIDGWAMEARLYAENPATGFLPSTGPLTHFRLPEATIRVDTGVEEGGEVSPFYDPMIAKLICHAPARAQAASQLADACREVEVWPVKTNAAFLARCLDAPAFVAEDVDTSFIERHMETLASPKSPSSAVLSSAAVALLADDDPTEEVWTPWSPFCGPVGFRLNAAPVREVRLDVGGEITTAELFGGGDAEDLLVGYGEVIAFEDGSAFEIRLPRAVGGAGEGAIGDGAILSPMPGKIVAVAAEEGGAVAKGAPLVTLEAMKMEHVLTAPFDGVVAEVNVKPGEQVSEGVMLARLKH
jgi:acetyl/propionyl-CoA carboxylase alpha subunit